MKARYLFLIGVGSLVAAAWGCAGGNEDVSNGGEGGISDLRSAPDVGDTFGATGEGGTAAGVTTESTSALAGGDAGPGDQTHCDFTKLGKIDLSPPDVRPFASPALARGFIDSGRAPSPSAVHAREFLNYYQPTYPATGTDVSVFAHVAPGAAVNEAVLQIAVQAPADQHRSLALVVVVDTSLSMAGESLMRARKAVESMARALRPGDSITLLTSSGERLLDTTTIAPDGDVQRAITASSQLEADGGDHLGAALADAYLVARSRSAELGRVVLITDGAARPDEIDQSIVAGGFQLAQVPLIGVGVGDAVSYESALIETAARLGGGTTIYLDSVEEAPRILQQRFEQIMGVSAEEVTVSLTLPEDLRIRYVEQPSSPGSLTGFARSDLSPGRAMVYRYVLESCKDIASFSAIANLVVTAKWRTPGSSDFRPDVTISGSLDTLGFTAATVAPQITKAAFVLDYADALMHVRTAQLYSIATAITALKADPSVPKELLADTDLDEIARLSQKFVDAATAPPAP